MINNSEKYINKNSCLNIGGVDKDTEFLTPNGWKKICDYENGDLVLGYNKQSWDAKFQHPSLFVKERCEKFYHFKNSKGLDQIVCDNHNMLVFKGYKKGGYNYFDVSPCDLISLPLNKGYYSFETTFNKKDSEISDTDVEIRIAVMIAADGCLRYSINDKLNKVELHFSKERKIDRAKMLLDLSGIYYTYKKYSNGTTFFYIKSPKKYDKNLVRFYKANSSQLKVLAEESLKWDGHEGYRSYYSSTNKENVDLIQYAFAASGIRAGISSQKATGNFKECYSVIPTKNSKVAYCKSNIISSADGFKYCFEMPDNYFLARRNGKIFITGTGGILK